MAVTTVPGDRSLFDSLRRRRVDPTQSIFRWTLLGSLLVALLILAVLVVDVFRDGLPVFQDRGADFLSAGLSRSAERAGIGQAIVGSLLLGLIIAVVAFPLGVAAAIYLQEYARDTRTTRLFNVTVRNLAGVPSIVYGILGLAIFVQALKGILGPTIEGRSVLAGGLTLAVLVLPIVIITTQEALRAVPTGIREAAYGVGATRWEMIRSHVLPNAAPGILTGTILSLARGIGETAPLILVGATTGFLSTGGASLFEQLRGAYTALPMVVFQWSAREGADFRPLAAGAILVLIVVIFAVNAAAIVLRNRYDRKW